MSTGNFNEKTARIYADHGLLTADKAITDELKEVFKHLEDKEYQPPQFQHLLVAQFISGRIYTARLTEKSLMLKKVKKHTSA